MRATMSGDGWATNDSSSVHPTAASVRPASSYSTRCMADEADSRQMPTSSWASARSTALRALTVGGKMVAGMSVSPPRFEPGHDEQEQAQQREADQADEQGLGGDLPHAGQDVHGRSVHWGLGLEAGRPTVGRDDCQRGAGDHP